MNVTHEIGAHSTDEWLTPKYIIDALGCFDLDPCSPIKRPWNTAKHHFTVLDNGLLKPWFGRVWCNPPYSDIKTWLQKCAEYQNVTALVFARTETVAFQEWVWPKADSIFFFGKRLCFHRVDGSVGKNAGAPSVLISYNQENSDMIASANLYGKHLPVNYTPMIVVGISPKWMTIVKIAIRNAGESDLKPIYDVVERIAPEKISKNPHWKAKVRQQLHFMRKKQIHRTLSIAL